jgi:hypothetical protein
MDSKKSPLTSVLSPRRGEADRHARCDVTAVSQLVASPHARGEGEGEELVRIQRR